MVSATHAPSAALVFVITALISEARYVKRPRTLAPVKIKCLHCDLMSLCAKERNVCITAIVLIESFVCGECGVITLRRLAAALYCFLRGAAAAKEYLTAEMCICRGAISPSEEGARAALMKMGHIKKQAFA